MARKTPCEVTAEELDSIVDGLLESYRDFGGINHLEGPNLPSQEAVGGIVRSLERLLFPGFAEKEPVGLLNVRYAVGKETASVLDRLTVEICKSLRYAARTDGGEMTADEATGLGRCIAIRLLNALPDIREVLASDATAALQGDPAARSLAEVLLSYPGLHALAVHRMAHFLHLEEVPLIPRMMAERMHEKTGIDIHPGAQIGRSFFIDHGTGVVIGETTLIGDRVKVYQGVTLGALSVPANACELVRRQKRHPTIEDDVTIYAGATILGGETVIGSGSIIGGNVWLTQSVPAGTKVLFDSPRLRYARNGGGARSPGHGVALDE